MILVAVLLLGLLTGIFYFMPMEAVLIALVFIIGIVLYYFILRAVRGQQVREKKPSRWQNFSSLIVIFLAIFILFAIFLREVVTSVLIQILLV